LGRQHFATTIPVSMSETTHRALRLALASLLTAALFAQLVIGMSRAELTVVNFFSFFTILSNTASVVMLAMLAWRPASSSSPVFSLFRGAVTVYMSVTGLVNAVLLVPTGIDVGLSEPWVDWSLHVVGPVALAADWILAPPGVRLPQHGPLVWLVFPAVYLIYSLIRGAIVDWYPYPFLDPLEMNGYGQVLLWVAVVLVVVLVFSYAYHWWANRRVTRPATT
jgi:hypothetical protein